MVLSLFSEVVPTTPDGLDAGIAPYVEILRSAGVETFESCEGGYGHTYPEATIRFAGSRGEGLRALAVAVDHRLPVRAIRRYWAVIDGEPCGPDWEMAFWSSATCPRR